MSFAELAKKRYSVRKYTDQPVEAEKLAALLEQIVIAPTACNNQPQRVKVITAQEELALIDQCTPCRFGAPLVMMICADSDAAWVSPFDSSLNSSYVDASIVTTHLMLAATDLGLGSVWVMYFDVAKAKELFKLSESIIPIALLPIGYAAPDAEPADRHAISQPLESLLL